jgi:hypothetical protein
MKNNSNSLAKVNQIWRPNPGSQALFLSCPYYEVLYEGTRGPGKSDALLMDYAQHVGVGFGQHWRGIVFREEYKQLEDIIAKSKRWFFQIFPGAKFNEGDYFWAFPKGERLYFRHIQRRDDYWKYHGHEYPFIGWEELTNWKDNVCYEDMKACCRSSHPGMPRKIRSTANSYGRGHQWVRAYFIDPAPPGVPITNEHGQVRVRIRGIYKENRYLEAADPDYIKNIKANPDPVKRKAWLTASWEIVSGGALEGCWEPTVHCVKPFVIPEAWRKDRAFDWGSYHPFAVGWFAESDGTTFNYHGQDCSFPRGSVFLIAEYYGWNGNANQGCKMLAVEIARKILEIEKSFPYKVLPGAADDQLWNAENGVCFIDDFNRAGVRWIKADKRAGSRKAGLGKLQTMLKASIARALLVKFGKSLTSLLKEHIHAGTIHQWLASLLPKTGSSLIIEDIDGLEAKGIIDSILSLSESPGLYIFDTCRHWIRTVPALPRDPRDMDDVDSETEDHMYDMTRYRIMTPRSVTTSHEFIM